MMFLVLTSVYVHEPENMPFVEKPEPDGNILKDIKKGLSRNLSYSIFYWKWYPYYVKVKEKLFVVYFSFG